MRGSSRIGIISATWLVGVLACSSEREDLGFRSAQDLDPALASEDMDESQGVEPPGRNEDPGTPRRIGHDDLQILAVSDWHGQLDPVAGPTVAGRASEVGGAAYLSSYFKRARLANPRTITVTSGDAYGATPPLSGLFKDEPAAKALNLMGLTAYTFGNHDFDSGTGYLQNLINVSTFKYVSSNLNNLGAELSGVHSPTLLFDVDGVRVGLIGITNDDAPSLLFPGSLKTMTVADSATAANTAAKEAKSSGAKVVIVLAHMGATAINAAGTATGPLLDFAAKLEHVDVVIGDHTDIQFQTRIGKMLVVENKSKGAGFAQIGLTMAGSAVLESSAEFVRPYSKIQKMGADGKLFFEEQIAPDAEVVGMLAPYRKLLSAAYDKPVAVASGVFTRSGNAERLREVPLGNLVADAVRLRYGVQVAFVNGGGLRTAIPSNYLPANKLLRRTSPGYAAGPPYDVVVGDVYSLLPFGNTVTTRTVTGTQLWAVCEKSLGWLPASNGGFLQISGMKWTYSASAPSGARCKSIKLDDGTAIANDGTTYTAATSNFTNAGGDGYTMLADGSGLGREVMADVVLEHIKAAGTISPTTSSRIVALP